MILCISAPSERVRARGKTLRFSPASALCSCQSIRSNPKCTRFSSKCAAWRRRHRSRKWVLEGISCYSQSRQSGSSSGNVSPSGAMQDKKPYLSTSKTAGLSHRIYLIFQASVLTKKCGRSSIQAEIWLKPFERIGNKFPPPLSRYRGGDFLCTFPNHLIALPQYSLLIEYSISHRCDTHRDTVRQSAEVR